MIDELIQTLQFIKDRYGSRTTGSVFILMKDFPWYGESYNQLSKLHEAGAITKPRFYDNGAEITLTEKGHNILRGILFPAKNTPMTCPVCGFRARVINTDAERSWAEIHCENCMTYALKKDALGKLSPSDYPFLSGYYRHVRHDPMTMQCDTQETVFDHVTRTRKIVTHDYQISLLLNYYYQKMNDFGDKIPLDKLPAIAYAKDVEELTELAFEAEEKGFAILDKENITVTEKGKEWMDSERVSGEKIPLKSEMFISHRQSDSGVADVIKDFLVNTGIPNEKIFCSSLPGNDVHEKISLEVKNHLKNATIIILILTAEYYESAYCLNEAGIAWFLDDVEVIPVGLPEIEHKDMRGFINDEYKLRRLDENTDVSYLYDCAHKRLRTKTVDYSVVARETQKLQERYEKHIADRKSASAGV